MIRMMRRAKQRRPTLGIESGILCPPLGNGLWEGRSKRRARSRASKFNHLAGVSRGECPHERQALPKIEGEREKKEARLQSSLAVSPSHQTSRSFPMRRPARRIAAMGSRPSADTSVPLHIERTTGADPPATAEYAVSVGGSKAGVGTVLMAKRMGLGGLSAFLASLSIASSEIESACRVLTEELHYDIPDVRLTRVALRRFGG